MTRRIAAAALVALALTAAAGAAPAADPGVTSDERPPRRHRPADRRGGGVRRRRPGREGVLRLRERARRRQRAEDRLHATTTTATTRRRPSRLTRQLVEQDKVFAIFDGVGTANNLAIRDYLNAMKVPQLFVGDGSQQIGEPRPRTRGRWASCTSYRGEGDVYGRDARRHDRRRRSPCSYENTELGKDLLTGLTRASSARGRRSSPPRHTSPRTPTSSSQIARLKASGADTLHALRDAEVRDPGRSSPRNKLGWKPHLYITSISIEPTIMEIAR